MSEEKCEHCGKTKKQLKLEGVVMYFHGKDAETGKDIMICSRDFYDHYEWKKNKKGLNIFVKKKET